MWFASGLMVLAFVILGHAFRKLQGIAFLGGIAVALMLVLSALGPVSGHSIWWWVYAARHTAAHLTATF
jgi:hypothetical protein